MTVVQLSSSAAESLANACSTFSSSVVEAGNDHAQSRRTASMGTFRSSAEIADVYGNCASSSLPSLLEDFKSQSDAMAALFRIAGGLLSAQDEEAAAALKNAASAPPSINGPSFAIAGLSSISAFDTESSRTDKFSWVAGEDASGMSLDEMKSGAQSLSPGDLRSTAEQFSNASQTLSSAADQLLASVNSELGSSWQGEFANTALANVAQFHGSATELAGQLTTVADRASSLAEGYEFTRERVGGITPGSGTERDSDAAASREAARQDAQRVIHSDYNPRLESANLSGLAFTPAHRVGSAGGVGTEGVSPVALWNREIASPEGGTGGSSRTDAATQAASSSAGGGASAGTLSPAGGGGSLSSTGSPVTGTSTASGNAASGVMSAGVGTSAGGGTRPVSATASGPGRSGHAATAPASTGTTVASGRASSSSPVWRTVSGTSSSSPLGTHGPRGGASSIGGGSAGARPLSATAGGSVPRSGLPFSSGGSAPGGSGASSGTGASSGLPRAGAGQSVGTGLTAGSGSPGTSPGSAGSAAGARMGGPMMGAMPMGAGGRGGNKAHSPADYLVHPSHSSELIGDLPAAVQPVLRGSRTSAE